MLTKIQKKMAKNVEKNEETAKNVGKIKKKNTKK